VVNSITDTGAHGKGTASAQAAPARTMKVEEVPLAEVVPDPANARVHDERNLEAIKGSLARFGQQKPIVVDQAGVIRAGNGTYAAAKALGWPTIKVVRTDLSSVDATAYSIADNRTSDLSEFDDQALAQLLRDLRAEDALEGVGFAAAEIDELLAGLEAGEGGLIEDPGAGEPPEEPVTRPGDLWILGKHRLLCGDSGSTEDVDRLVAGAPIHLVNADPVYNVRVEPRSNNAIAAGLSSFSPSHHQKLDLARHPSKAKATGKLRPKDRPLENDFVSDEEFARLLRAWFGNASRKLLPGRTFYVWGGYANLANYPAALKECGLYFSQAIIWNKLHPVLTRKDFMGAHEWCFYGWKEGAAHQFFGPNNATDLWEIKKVNPQSMIHLTEKPVELAERAILYSSRAGENVLDLFGGSGSSLIGCERTGRKAFLMEIDAPYCDVIVERWQKATGKDAVLEATAQTFAQVADERGSGA
jgi:DNA modification methylase